MSPCLPFLRSARTLPHSPHPVVPRPETCLVRSLIRFPILVSLSHDKIFPVRVLTQLREIWNLPDKVFPPGFDAAAFFSTGAPPATAQVFPNVLLAPAPQPEVVAAAAAVHADQMLSPPESSVDDDSESDSPSDTEESDDDSESESDGGESPASSSVTPGDHTPLSSPTQPTAPHHPYPLVASYPQSQAMPPHLLHHHMTPPPGGTASEVATFHDHTGIPPAVLAAYGHQAANHLAPPANQHLGFFVKEVLKRSRTDCVTVEFALCYLSGVRDRVRDLMNERQHVTSLARQQNVSPQSIDRTGAYNSPLADPRRTFLASLVLAHKFHKDRAYANKAWARLSGLPPREVSRCEKALGDALQWRLWAGCQPPSAKELLGLNVENYIAPPLGDDGLGRPATGIVSSGRCLSPPLLNVSADMLADEMYHEEVQRCGVHATYGGMDGLPGESDATAAFLMEVSRRSEETFVPVPRTKRNTFAVPALRPASADSSFSMSTEGSVASFSCIDPSLLNLVFLEPSMPQSSFGPIRREVHARARGYSPIAGPRPRRLLTPASSLESLDRAQWDHVPSGSQSAPSSRGRESPFSRTDSRSSTASITTPAFGEVLPTLSGSYLEHHDVLDTILEEPFVASPTMTQFDLSPGFLIHPPGSQMLHVGSDLSPPPKKPVIPQATIPVSCLVGAFRPSRTPPPMGIPSEAGAPIWHPPPNL